MLAIYCRHSKPKEEAKDTAIPTQKLYGVQLAESLFMDHAFYIDKGISGTSIEGREGMQNLVKDIKSKKISAVYAYDQSRIERDTSFWLEFCSIVVDNDVRYFENTKEIDLSDPTNVMNTTMQSAFSAYYAAQTSVKVKESIKRNAEKGKVRGILPYGYTKDEDGFVVKHPEQAKIVERIYKLSLSGEGTYTISNILNK
jgi:site-specific DNA recombinase